MKVNKNICINVYLDVGCDLSNLVCWRKNKTIKTR